MRTDNPPSTARIAGHPIHAMLVPFPLACFVGTLLTDIAYARTYDLMWANFSSWLLLAGLVFGALAALAGLIDFTSRRVRAQGPAWPHALGNVIALVLAFFNALVHSRDGYTSVVPTGLILSSAVVLILIVTAWLGSSLVYRHGVGGGTVMRAGIALGLTAALALAACGEQGGGDPKRQIGPNPYLPEIQQYLMPPMHVAKIAKWGSATPTVAAGLQVRALATGLEHPRQLYILPNGDILVVESSGPKAPVNRPKTVISGLIQGEAGAGAKGGMRITLLRDTNGDGVPDLRTIFLDHLVSPYGVALVGNDFYVANTDAVVRFPYVEGQTQITAPGVKLTDLPGGPIDHHWTKSMVASRDGTKLYVGVGSNSNIAENGIEAEKDRAAIWEIDRATGASRIFASGTRNPTGLAWEPTGGKLWTIVNERDELGPDLVPDYMTSVKDGGFYGWPYSYYGQHIDPRIMPQRPDLVATAIAPDYALSSHVAPLGIAFYTGTNLPEAYRGGAFIGEHGSWNRPNLNGYKVVYVPFADGKPNGMARDVVTGFLDADEHARGRPVGLAVDRTGALLIADDLGNTVWRVSAVTRTASR